MVDVVYEYGFGWVAMVDLYLRGEVIRRLPREVTSISVYEYLSRLVLGTRFREVLFLSSSLSRLSTRWPLGRYPTYLL